MHLPEAQWVPIFKLIFHFVKEVLPVAALFYFPP
jgi:hypothetical protein